MSFQSLESDACFLSPRRAQTAQCKLDRTNFQAQEKGSPRFAIHHPALIVIRKAYTLPQTDTMTSELHETSELPRPWTNGKPRTFCRGEKGQYGAIWLKSMLGSLLFWNSWNEVVGPLSVIRLGICRSMWKKVTGLIKLRSREFDCTVN